MTTLPRGKLPPVPIRQQTGRAIFFASFVLFATTTKEARETQARAVGRSSPQDHPNEGDETSEDMPAVPASQALT